MAQFTSDRALKTPPCSEVRRGHLGVEEVVLFHQEFARLAGNAHGRMVVDDIIPTVLRSEPINGSKIDPRFPFRRRNFTP
jgi:hypothetical protein